MEHIDDILPLLYKQLQSTLTPEESDKLAVWLAANPRNQALLDDLNNDQSLQEQFWLHQPANWAIVEEAITNNLQNLISVAQPTGRMAKMKRWYWMAASVLLLMSIVSWLWFRSGTNNNQDAIVSATPAMIEPGKNGAVLTLADGSQVVLDSLGNGLVAQQAGAEAILKNGRLVYGEAKEAVAVTAYNTMSTPKGRQFQITLPDGTRVWLNAESSIRYPTQFNGREREVNVTGEIYLEVAKDASKPFFVRVNHSTRVAVLGTSFNVNAYTNEPSVNMTLVEGKISVAVNDNHVMLTPGKQAQVLSGNVNVISVDTDKIIAWKSGLFNLNNLSFAAIMRQIERWYDIEVMYENGVPNVPMMGEISRDVPLQGLLKNLERMGMKYRLEGRKLIVSGS